MRLVAIVEEDFINYKKPSMVLAFPFCTFKCERENPTLNCQNSWMATAKVDNYHSGDIIQLYKNNPITEAIVCQGLEPFESFEELLDFLKEFRKVSNDDFVIYTGFDKFEIEDKVKKLQKYPNVIIKFGRLLPSDGPHYDVILGVNLFSNNQYAEKIS